MKIIKTIGKGDWGLTPKQEEFCHEYLKNGGNAKAAYLSVYQVTEGTASVGGSQLTKKPEVQKYLIHLREKIKNENLISLEDIVNNVKDIEKKAKAEGKRLDIALDANKFLARLMGFDKETPFGNSPSITQPIQINILPPIQNNKDEKIEIKFENSEGEK